MMIGLSDRAVGAECIGLCLRNAMHQSGAHPKRTADRFNIKRAECISVNNSSRLHVQSRLLLLQACLEKSGCTLATFSEDN